MLTLILYLAGCRSNEVYPLVQLSQFMITATAVCENLNTIHPHGYMRTERKGTEGGGGEERERV